MKRRINELLNENFTYEPAKLQITPQELTGKIRLQEQFRAKIAVNCPAGALIHAFVYSTNPRMTVNPEIFTGRRETLQCKADLKGLDFGDVVEGELVVCTTMGEQRVPYRLEIAGEEKERETVRQMTPEEFALLAKEDFGQAYILFTSGQFRTMLERWGDFSQALYEGIVGQSVTYHSLEQFLVGMNLKEPVQITLASDSVFLRNPETLEREELMLTKNTWGFASIQITCDAPFLTIERPQITTEEFVGSTCSVGYILNKEYLHAGRNFARITVRSQCRAQECVVEVRNCADIAPGQMRRRRKQEIVQLMNAYIDWRAGRTGTKEWSGISLLSIENAKRNGETHLFFDLYRAYLLLCAGDETEGQIQLQTVTERKKELTEAPWKGFYLYLTTFENDDKEYNEYVREEIQRLFLENQENWLLQLLMLRVNEKMFRNDSEKLDAVRRQYACGCKSPALYLEAWEILKREPLMLRSLEGFEVHLLRFLCRERLLDREICGQAAQLACRAVFYQPLLYDVLCRCFEAYPSKNLLTAICSLLMKGHKTAPKYAKWFDLGIRQDVRLAGMYEYYAQTMQDLSVRTLPPAVRMYFSYNNTLSNAGKAAVYANIIRSRAGDEETFEAYRPVMERFMEEALMQGRVSDDLALIYEALLTRYVMTPELADGLANAFFTYEITVASPQIRHVVAVHRQLHREQRVSVSDAKAYVQIFSSDCCILLEDQDGMRYALPELSVRRKLLTRPIFEEYCREMEKEPQAFLLYDCCSSRESTDVTEENAARFVQMMTMHQIRESYRKMLQKKLLVYYTEHPRSASVEAYLAHADYALLTKSHMKELAELLTGENRCEEAYALVCSGKAEKVEAKTLVRLCSFMLTEQEQQEDAQLLALCMRCFNANVYDEAVLKYLLHYYEGPLDVMKALWQAGQRFLLEDFALEEKILVMILFLREGMADTEDIFTSYLKKDGKEKLCRAYVIWMSYCYFVKEISVRQPVFAYIEQRMLGELVSPQICELAILRRYVAARKRGAGQHTWMLRLLEKYAERGMHFAFYKELPNALLRRYHLHDKYILEYRTNPANHVTLCWQLNDGREKRVPMNHIYEGIFVKEFTLFYNDRLKWHICVEEQEAQETDEQVYVCGRRSTRGSTGKYELLNRLTEAAGKKDEAQIAQIRAQYQGQQYFVDELFRIN